MKKKIILIVVSFFLSTIIWISINLTNEYYYTLTLPLRIVNLQEGYSIASKIPEEIAVKIKTNGWKIIALSLSNKNEYHVRYSHDTARTNINLANSISENPWLTSDIQFIDIIPKNIYLALDKRIESKLPVKPLLDLTFREGFGLSHPITFSPAYLAVYGSQALLRTVDTIFTRRTVLRDLEESTTINLAVRQINGIEIEPDFISVHLDVQKIVEKEIQNIRVKLTNVPMDRSVLLIPSEISVTVRGGINILGRLSSDDIIASVDYKDLYIDTLDFVTPNIVLPQNVERLFSKPESVKFIIKKF